MTLAATVHSFRDKDQALVARYYLSDVPVSLSSYAEAPAASQRNATCAVPDLSARTFSQLASYEKALSVIHKFYRLYYIESFREHLSVFWQGNSHQPSQQLSATYEYFQ